MAEDLCLIQYVRDNFGEEYTHNYAVNGADDGDHTMDTLYCLDMSTFTESSTFDHSSATADAASNPDSATAIFVPELFSTSPSPCTAMESIESGPYGCRAYSPDGEPGMQASRSFPVPPFDPKENEYPMLAAYIGLPQANNIQSLEETFSLQAAPGSGQGQASLEGNDHITLVEMLQEQSAATKSTTSGISTSSDVAGERRTSFWRGKSPALLMQQLKGPSLSASSSSSEARSAIKSPPNQPNNTFQKSAPNLTFQSPLNLTALSNRDYRSDIKGANLPMVSTLSKSAPSLSGQRFLPPLGDPVTGTKSIISSDQGQTRILRSTSFDPQLMIGSTKLGDAEMQASTSMSAHLKQRRKIMPGIAILGEMQRNAASWSSSSTSPGPSSNIDQDKFNYTTMSVDRELILGGDRAWKKAKGELGSSTSSEGGAVQMVDLAPAGVEQQREKSQLQEKFLALLQTDSSTSKDYKAKILDDTIRYLKELRKRLNVNEADSTNKNVTQAPSRGWKLYGDGNLASPIHLEDLELETAGVEISPHLNVDNGPQIEVRMMENQHVMVKLTAKDRPGLFNDIMGVLRGLQLDIQHANIRTGNNGQRHDIFAAKMQLPFFCSQSTHSIAMALDQVISATAIPLAAASPELHTPCHSPDLNRH